MKSDNATRWPLDDPRRLCRYLPTIIREIQYVREWNDTQLADRIGVPRSTLGAWKLGVINTPRIDDKVFAELRTLRNDAQPFLWMKGIDGDRLDCLCNLAEVYMPNYQTIAEARCRTILAQPPSW